MFRYFTLLNCENIQFYDNRYIYLPKCKERIVISLTTIPQRIDKLKPVLISLLDQTYGVDKIYINIPYITLKGYSYKIPNWLSKLKNVTINRIEKDYGPASKLLPILQKEKGWIIVCDDDVIYGSQMVENYIKNLYRNCPLTIFGADIRNGNLKEEWPTFLRFRAGKYIDILMGHNSFLVKPEFFKDGVLDYTYAPKECIWVDDIWFSGWLKKKIYSLGTQYKNIPISLASETISLSSNNANYENNKIAINFFKNSFKWLVLD